MTSPWIAALFALFIWWFSTGAIMLAVRRARSPRMAVFSALPLLALGVAAVFASLADVTVAGAYKGFLGALAVWGWIELAFLAGVITGPERRPCPPGLSGGARFFQAWNTVAHHELLLTLGLLGMVMLTAHAANPIALNAYLILYFARIFAKLNLFFGVPRINTEFVPAPLDHLKTYFRRGPVTAAFPVAITALTVVLAVCGESLWSAPHDAATIGAALLTALAALALIEHWLMVVPLPDAKLWRWMLPAPKPMIPEERQNNGL